MASKNDVQISADNPGWDGSGIPSMISLFKKFNRLPHLLNSNPSYAKHFFLANIANLINFYLIPLGEASCPCCSWKGRSFLAKSNWRAVTYQSVCPSCDSRSRHRGLHKYIEAHASQFENKRCLVFAPERIVIQAITRDKVKQFDTTDYNSVDVDFPDEDIQNLSFENECYDVIICNHVLEHVQDDQVAINECARILDHDGMALFTIPGHFEKYATWEFEQLDNNGHYRHYGMDILEKFRNAFDKVEAINLGAFGSPVEHIRDGDYLFVCRVS